MRIGVTTLGDHLPDPHTGVRVSTTQRFREFVELGVIAEQLGYDSYHLGEHHFCEYVLSSPTPVLAAVAERTGRVRLSTAVALLPHHDPVRIAEDYATVDQLSGGRVELLAGRGVFRDVYRQYGQDEAQSAAMLAESVDLIRRLWSEEVVSWSGTIRPPLDGVTLHPRPFQRPHPPIWLSASSEASVDRAVAIGCPIVIPTVSTGVALPAVLATRYRAGWERTGRDPAGALVGLHVHCYVGDGTTETARERWHRHQISYLEWVFSLARPGMALPPALAELGTPIAQAVCGSVDDVADTLARRVTAMGGVDVLLVQTDQGGLAWDEVGASLARFSASVVPKLKERVTDRRTD